MATSSSSSPLLSLPAELRLQIYTHVLCPTGTLCLAATPTRRFAVVPTVSPALLRTCRQIWGEAANLLHEQNAVTIAVDAHDLCWPTISETRLPPAARRKLRHLAVVLDCSSDGSWDLRYAGVDFDAFEDFVELRSVSIAVIADQDTFAVPPPDEDVGAGGDNAGDSQRVGKEGESTERPHVRLVELVDQILERVPERVQVASGFEQDPCQRQFLDRMIAVKRRERRRPGRLQQVPAAEVQRAVEAVPNRLRGRRSGGGWSQDDEDVSQE